MRYAPFYRSDGRTVKSGRATRCAECSAEALTSDREQVQFPNRVPHLWPTLRLLLHGDLSGPGAFGPPLWVASEQTQQQAND